MAAGIYIVADLFGVEADRIVFERGPIAETSPAKYGAHR